MSDWDQFFHWAKRLAAEVDLEAEERNYKIESANRWRAALKACRESREDWPVLLKRAANYGNLVDAFAQTWLRNSVDAQGDAVREAFVAVDASDHLASIDEFHATLKGWGDYISPGDATTFASLVRMSHAPETCPPYRAQFVADWVHRVGEDIGQLPAERYAALLAVCDDLIRIAPEHDLAVRDRLDAQGLAWTVMKSSPPVRWTPMDQAGFLAWREGKDPSNVTVPRGEGVAPSMEEAAWVVLGRGLRGEASALAPDLRTWTAENARELGDRIRNNPPGPGGFMDKLAAQVKGASDDVIVLLAELLYLRNAPLSDMRPATKTARVNAILGLCSTPRTLPAELGEALAESKAFQGGQGYHAQAPAHLQWLSRFVDHWVHTPEDVRAEGLRDPFAFREITASAPEDWPSIRYVIEYLTWPGIFPSVVSTDHRKRIHAGLMSDLGEPSGTDDRAITHDLVALQAFHNSRAKSVGWFAWYRAPLRERWTGEETPPKAWIVRPGEGGTALVDTWRDEGFVSLSARMLGTVVPGSSRPEVTQAVKEGYTHLDASQREATAAAYFAFLTTMRVDDVVATIDAGRLYVGVVTGEAHYVDAKGSRLRREVTWNPTATQQDDLDAPLPALLDQQGAVVEATAAYDILTALLDVADIGDQEEEPELPKPAPSVATTPQLPAVTDEVARSLHMDREPLQEIVDLLQQRRQVVLYGPPGTGKTYVAKELGRHLVGDPSRVRLVQFHPSYSYEDFIEGYRPTTTAEGHATFELKEGPLRELAAEARNPENRENAYILIVDEMNRANLAKVFGELYFLLEYRGESVRLQYRSDPPFFLPPNLFIIGTMNTTDRSIALVDAAIRRRFPFVELHPSEPPVSLVLGRYLAANGVSDDRAALLAELNSRMGEGGRDLQIGPSYLMRPEIRTEADLERVWRYDILPLIEEHFYGQMDRAVVRSTFGLAALRAALASVGAVAAAGSDGAPPDQGVAATD